MAGLVTIDDIVAGFNAPQVSRFMKVFTAPKATGAWHSGWLATGTPGTGATPPAYNAGSGYTCDKSTVGAIAYTNGSVKNWLARVGAGSTTGGTLIIYDRLWNCGGMGFAASTYTVTTPGNLPARITDGGLGCELWVEQIVAAGAATGTLVCNYKDSAAASKSGTIATLTSAPLIGQLQPVPLADNLGISQLVSVVNSGSWISGSWGMTIAKRIAEIPMPLAGYGGVLDWAELGIPTIPADACLWLVWLPASSPSPVIHGQLHIIDK